MTKGDLQAYMQDVIDKREAELASETPAWSADVRYQEGVAALQLVGKSLETFERALLREARGACRTGRLVQIAEEVKKLDRELKSVRAALTDIEMEYLTAVDEV